MSIRSRILKTAAVKTSEMVIVTVIRLVSVPLFLVAWGADLYGEWLIVTTLLTYLQMGNLGFAQTAANDMTMAVARDDKTYAVRVYQSTAVFLAGVAVIVLSVAALLPFLLPVGRWMNLSLIGHDDLHLIIVLIAGFVVMSFIRGLQLAGYRCEGKYHRGLLFMNLFLIVDFAGTVACLLAGLGPVFIGVVMLGARVITFGFMLVDLRRIAPWIEAGVSKASLGEIKRMISPSMSFMSYPVSMALINQGAVLAIGVIISPAMVVLFTATKTLTNIATRVFDLVNQAFYPEISMAWGAQKMDLLRRLHRTSCQASLWTGFFAIAFLAVFGGWIFEIWTGGRLQADNALLYGLLVAMAVHSAWYTSLVLPSAINKHQRVSLAYLVFSALALAGFVALLKVSSLYLALVSLVAFEVAMVLVVIPTSLSLSKDGLLPFASQVLRPPNPIAIMALLKKRAPTVV